MLRMYIVLASSRLYSAKRQTITGDDDDDEVLVEKHTIYLNLLPWQRIKLSHPCIFP